MKKLAELKKFSVYEVGKNKVLIVFNAKSKRDKTIDLTDYNFTQLKYAAHSLGLAITSDSIKIYTMHIQNILGL